MSSSPGGSINQAKDSNLQCSKQSEDDDLATPLDALLMLTKEASSRKSTDSVGCETRSKPKVIRVYTRRNKKGTTQKDHLSPKNDVNASMVDKLEEQGNNIVFQAAKVSESVETPDTNRVDKLLLLRDTMEALMNRKGEVQKNYARKSVYQAGLKIRGETPKEKFERLRIRQKQRIALSNLTIPSVPGERSNGQESMLLNPLPLSYISAPVENFHSKSADRIYSPLNSCKNLLILKDPRRFRWYRDNFAGKDPAISWKPNSEMQNRTAVPRLVKQFAWMSVGSNVSSSSRSSAKPTENSEIREPVTFWLEQELDSLWIGVRRHGEGKWEKILKDSHLYFSELKTEQDLAQRWETERQRILNSGGKTTTESQNVVSTELQLNSSQASQNQQNTNSGKSGTQNLLLGGLISISKAQLDQHKNAN